MLLPIFVSLNIVSYKPPQVCYCHQQIIPLCCSKWICFTEYFLSLIKYQYKGTVSAFSVK